MINRNSLQETPSAWGSLGHVSLRYLLRHPWQSILMVIGIMLGVAVVVAIDLANESASRAFDLSVDSIAGKATHQITGGPEGLDESLYTTLRTRLPDDLPLAPVMSANVTSPDMGDRPFTLLGVDVFAEAPFRNYLAGDEGVPVENITAFLTTPNAILISKETAERYGLGIGDTVRIALGGQNVEATITGLITPNDSLAARSLADLILADMASAQELTGRYGQIDRIDLLIPESDTDALDRVAALLPGGTSLTAVSARTGSVAQMTDAFRTNLTALSLLALVVGMFLIYNTMTFSVVQRRPLFGTLRCLGVTRREVFFMVMTEALIVGILGSLLGLVLGTLMGQGAVKLVTRTINDLFFVLSVQGIQIPLVSLIKGGLLGLAATLATAAPPAWEAASVPPRMALSRANVESKARQVVNKVALAGVAATGLGTAMLFVPIEGLVASFLGTFAVIVGAAMMTPYLMTLILRWVTPGSVALWGALGRMAPRGLDAALSRTSIAVAALMVAVSVTIGISVMVGSFRYTVQVWLRQTLQGDIYISVPGGTASSPSLPVDEQVLEALKEVAGIERIDTVRAVTVDAEVGPVQLLAVNNPTSGEARLYLAQEGASPAETWDRVEAGAALISEPFMRRHDIPLHGGRVTLITPQGPRSFDIAGIYYDYGSTQGQVMIADAVYREIWDDEAVTAVALWLAEDLDVDMMTKDLQEQLVPIQQVDVQANQALRNEVLLIFDQTFAITGALNVLATIVAFIGVLSALLSLQLEKQRELGILRAVGMTIRQVWGLTVLETSLLGAIAGVLSWPTGFALSLILVYIINRRSFGWTLQMQVEPGPFVAAFAVAVVASLLAGVYPAWRLSRMAASDAIRYQ